MRLRKTSSPLRMLSVAFSPPMRRRYSSLLIRFRFGFAIVFLAGNLFEDACIESVFGCYPV